MDARTFRYYLWAWPMVLACSAFYTVIVMVGLKELITLEDTYFYAIGITLYVIFCFCGLRYYAPKMKKIEFGETLEGRYTSVRASRIAIGVGALIGTVLFIPQLDKITCLSDVPRWGAISLLFIAFAAAIAVFSHCVWKPGRGR
ncbi:hypothetical protein NTD84_25820 [Pseudomonas sp. 14P_8.1_Bac3]|uniref:hypothetical protein n=1 Tax=Pseudomonas sp. 14P_8.1_Bac3 TaxID=2971621 RepID=UPI0021C62CC6|nr:hypothetical protein [Pseudomonas sp. 14P_8.1_Bac3]MCU1763120.1 hypothetical protein [Pseudomonas sp. 14P_8.1_Bac3]